MINWYVGAIVLLFLTRSWFALQRLDTEKEVFIRSKETEIVKIGMNITFAAIGAMAILSDTLIK